MLRDDTKQALRNGLDRDLERTRARHSRKVGHENTFEQFVREGHTIQMPRWKPVHADDVTTSMEQSLVPEIGGIPVDQIDEGLLRHTLRKVEGRGAIETPHGCASAPSVYSDMRPPPGSRTAIPPRTCVTP